MTQIDIAALVADLTGPIPVIEGLSGPYPDGTAIRDTADQAAAALIAQDAELKRYRAALERCLNFIQNTESEMGETLQCGDIARAALGEKP